MRFLALSALALTTSLSAHADPVADLKTALAGLSGQGTVHAQAAFTFSSKNGNDKNSVPAETTIKVAAEDGPDGLRVTWSHDLLQAVAEESKAKSADPEKRTPTARALGELGVEKFNRYLNAVPEILRSLEHAKLLEEKSDLWQGRPARLLSFKLDLPLSEKDKKIVKEANAILKIWVGADGLPIAAQRSQHFKGRAMLVITFEMSQEESFEYTRIGNRLVAVRHSEEQDNSGAGESSHQKTTTVLTVTE